MTIGDLYNANNVVVGQAAVFVAAEGTALPALTGWNPNDPFDETFFTGGDFVPVGATEQGWQWGASKSTQTIQIEEQSTPVDTTITSQAISLQANLSEDVTSTLALTMNAVATAHVASATTPGYDDLTLLDIPLYYSVCMVTLNTAADPDNVGRNRSFGRLIYAPKWTSLGNISASFRRAAGQRLYAAAFSTVCNTEDIQVKNFTAEKTA